MSASIIKNKDQYVRLMRQFVNSEVDAKTFEEKFLEMRRRDLDRDAALKKSWPEPYDEQLIAAYQSGKLTKSEFTKRWSDLWGYSEKNEWLDIFDELFTDVDRFEGGQEVYRELSKERPLEYLNADQLKKKVRTYLDSIEKQK